MMLTTTLLTLALVPPACAGADAAQAPVASSMPVDGWRSFQQHCLACHVQGGSSPLLLDTRAAIARKAATIGTVLRERFMPPWLPTGGGPFAHDAITDAERDAIAAWAKAGAAGAPESPVAPTSPASGRTIAEGWEVPVTGVHMRSFACETGPGGNSSVPLGLFHSLRIVRASAAVERVMLSDDPTDSVRALDERDPGPGTYTRGDAPGSPAGSLAIIGVDSAFTLPDGWVLGGEHTTMVAELHAVGRGAPMPATVTIFSGPLPSGEHRHAEVFAAGPLGAIACERGELSTRTDSGPLTCDVDVGVIGLRTDERCTSATVRAIAPDGTERPLLEIRSYREGLDRAYRFEPTVPLVRGTVLRIDTVHGDELAAKRAQPMAILWCARRGTDAFAPRAVEAAASPEAIPADAVPGTTPADGMTWYDAVAACNARSEREGLAPAYRIEHPVRSDGRIVRATVTRLPTAGWHLPRAVDIAPDPGAPADRWWWTDDDSGLSGFTMVALQGLRRDALPPSARIPGVWSGMTRPPVAAPAK